MAALLLHSGKCQTRNRSVAQKTGTVGVLMKVSELLDLAYNAARGTENLDDPKFTRNQMYWKGRADAANAIRKLKEKLYREGAGNIRSK